MSEVSKIGRSQEVLGRGGGGEPMSRVASKAAAELGARSTKPWGATESSDGKDAACVDALLVAVLALGALFGAVLAVMLLDVTRALVALLGVVLAFGTVGGGAFL